MNKSLERKFKDIFGSVSVNKRLASEGEIARVPRYIGEYLVARYGNDGDPESMLRINLMIQELHPHPREKEKIKNELKENETLRILDNFEVTTDLAKGVNWARIPLLGENRVYVTKKVIQENPNLLNGGLWGIGTVLYSLETKRITLSSLVPLQASRIDLDYYVGNRDLFTKEEWIEILIHTIGLNPDVFSHRQRLLLLARLIPLVEENVNLIELGPKSTGKTFIYRNISNNCRVVSGGKVTPATLFVNLGTKAGGLLVQKDCIVLDEIQSIKLEHGKEIIGILKDYMESGYFSRGGVQLRSTASIVMLGNIPLDNDGFPISESYFEQLPEELRDTALIHRIHGLIPGWELPIIKESRESLSHSYGFISDYFGQVLHRLRSSEVGVRGLNDFYLKNADIRDEKAVKRLVKGFIRLIYPSENYSMNELREMIELSIELRRNVRNQLTLLDPEFKHSSLDYVI